MRFFTSLFALAMLLASTATVWCCPDSWLTSAYTFPSLLSASSPGLASFNGKLYIAINGAFNAVGIASSSDGGFTWTSPNWILSSIVSNNQPSLAVFNNKLYVGVYVSGANGFCLSSSSDGSSWTGCNTVNSGDVYKGAVSLATFKGQLYYTAAGSGVGFCVSSSSDGSSFNSCQWVQTQLSVASPALVANGNSSLQLVWSASSQVSAATSTDGATWSSVQNILEPAATNTKPAIVYLNGVQYAAYVGLDYGVYLSHTTESGDTLIKQLAAAGSSAALNQAPAIAVVGANNLAVAWEGQGQPIYVRASN